MSSPHSNLQESTNLTAGVLWAFIPAHQRLLYGVWKSVPKNRPIPANFPYFGKLAFDLYDLRLNVSINMADIEDGFVNVCEKFWISALNDYQREAITQFVNNTGIARWFRWKFGQDRVIDF